MSYLNNNCVKKLNNIPIPITKNNKYQYDLKKNISDPTTFSPQDKWINRLVYRLGNVTFISQ